VECGDRLEEKPVEDMLDIVHYFFECDVFTTAEEHQARSAVRQLLYRELYGREYEAGDSADSTANGGREFGTQEVASGDFFPAAQVTADQFGVPTAPGGPKLTHKPYIPPTPVDPTSPTPFGNVLDAPLG
jgi:hypothetical protein